MKESSGAESEVTEKANSIGLNVQWLMEKDSFLGLGDATDVSSMTVYLLNDASRYIIGLGFVVDGGLLLGNR